jgi:hypothetical protein
MLRDIGFFSHSVSVPALRAVRLGCDFDRKNIIIFLAFCEMIKFPWDGFHSHAFPVTYIVRM